MFDVLSNLQITLHEQRHGTVIKLGDVSNFSKVLYLVAVTPTPASCRINSLANLVQSTRLAAVCQCSCGFAIDSVLNAWKPAQFAMAG